MSTSIPSVSQVRGKLSKLGHAQLQRLSRLSGVPFNTLWNVRQGTTENPGIETVRKFLPHVDSVRSA